MNDMNEQVTVYTDGSCYPNPGCGGWAWMTSCKTRQASGSKLRSTNNEMELEAIRQAVLAFSDCKRLVIKSDSEYAIKCITAWGISWSKNGWKTKKKEEVKNKEIIRDIMRLMDRRDIKLEWVRGHSGDPINELVDELANNATGISPEDRDRFETRFKRR